MFKLHYQPAGTWFGDCMPFFRDGQFYLFHQRDTRNPGPFGEPFGWSLVRTPDFVHYEDLGESLARGGDDEQDQFIYAGSVFEGAGVYHAIYTGYNRDFRELNRPSQVIMLATSTDLVTWKKSDRQVVLPQPGYDPDDWRDPYVLWDDTTERYVMLLGARTVDGGKILTGRTVYFSSADLEKWTFEGDFWAPGIYSMHEMPDLFKMGEYWYLLTTEYSHKSKTVYRMSRSLSGPWTAPADDAFDGRAYYAARSVSDGDKRYLVGWVPTKEAQQDLGDWQWGGTLVVHEVYQREDGSLGVRIPTTVKPALANGQAVPGLPIRLTAPDTAAEQYLAKQLGDHFHFEATVRFTSGTRSFAIRLFENETSGEAYGFSINVSEARLNFDRRGTYRWNAYNNKGLERPLSLAPATEHRLQIVADDTIATIYIDGVALSARMYAKTGAALAMHVINGELEILGATLDEIRGT